MNKTTEALQNLVSGLNQTYWSSWQSTEKFMDALDKAEEVLKEERIRSAEGEAKAIAIQAAAIDKQGGAAYVQLKALEKWDGKLPVYMTSGAATPFVQVK